MTNNAATIYAAEMRTSGFNEEQIESAVETLVEITKECEYGLCAGDGEYPTSDGPDDFVMLRCPCTYQHEDNSKQD